MEINIIKYAYIHILIIVYVCLHLFVYNKKKQEIRNFSFPISKSIKHLFWTYIVGIYNPYLICVTFLHFPVVIFIKLHTWVVFFPIRTSHADSQEIEWKEVPYVYIYIYVLVQYNRDIYTLMYKIRIFGFSGFSL